MSTSFIPCIYYRRKQYQSTDWFSGYQHATVTEGRGLDSRTVLYYFGRYVNLLSIIRYVVKGHASNMKTIRVYLFLILRVTYKFIFAVQAFSFPYSTGRLVYLPYLCLGFNR